MITGVSRTLIMLRTNDDLDIYGRNILYILTKYNYDIVYTANDKVKNMDRNDNICVCGVNCSV